jgi:tRNA 2-thiouridine synthesizing protein E
MDDAVVPADWAEPQTIRSLGVDSASIWPGQGFRPGVRLTFVLDTSPGPAELSLSESERSGSGRAAREVDAMKLQVNNRMIEADEEGYLRNSEDWNEDVARLLALHDNVELTDTHWGLIHYFRDDYKATQRHPSMHELVMALGRHLGASFSDRKAYEKFLYELFPRGPIQTLSRLAGLPKPMRDVQD